MELIHQQIFALLIIYIYNFSGLITSLTLLIVIVSGYTGADPLINFGQFELPKPTNLICRHIALGNPLQHSFSANA